MFLFPEVPCHHRQPDSIHLKIQSRFTRLENAPKGLRRLLLRMRRSRTTATTLTIFMIRLKSEQFTVYRLFVRISIQIFRYQVTFPTVELKLPRQRKHCRRRSKRQDQAQGEHVTITKCVDRRQVYGEPDNKKLVRNHGEGYCRITV